MSDNGIFIGQSTKREELYLSKANRHGLVTGATGTGKTVTLQILAEGFSSAGVPVFAADIKGDLSGIAEKGEPKDFLLKRAEKIGFDDYGFDAFPAIFYDLFGVEGHPIRTTVSDMGPVLLSRLMGLSDAQEGALNILFRIADEEGLLVLDLKDLRALLADIATRGGNITTQYGNVSDQTIGAIQRRLVVLEEQGGTHFFGEPAFKIADLMRTTRDGRGYVSVLAADKLMESPQLYATFLLWLMSELFEELPEVGDPEKPSSSSSSTRRICCSTKPRPAWSTRSSRFSASCTRRDKHLLRNPEPHRLFPRPSSPALQPHPARLSRLHASRPKGGEGRGRNVARTRLSYQQAITELGVGEALVSVLDEKGIPTIVERTLIRPPSGKLGPIDPATRSPSSATARSMANTTSQSITSRPTRS